MPQAVSEIMTTDPETCELSAGIADAAKLMRDRDIGAVIAVEDGAVRGIVTDRDIVVRGLAQGRSSDELRVGDVCSGDVETLTPDDTLDEAIRIVRERHVRRVPVVDGDRPVGIVSIGDLAIERDPDSALGEISAAPSDS